MSSIRNFFQISSSGLQHVKFAVYFVCSRPLLGHYLLRCCFIADFVCIQLEINFTLHITDHHRKWQGYDVDTPFQTPV